MCGAGASHCADERCPLVAPVYVPVRPGALLGPGDRTGGFMCIALSPVDENLWWAGARPDNVDGLLEQVRRGPCSWWMLLSCCCFLGPAAVHLHMREGAHDLLAGAALAAVAVTSSLCDAFCVHPGVYDAGPDYERTAAAVGKDPGWVKDRIRQGGAEAAVLAADHWNNLTRLVDRAVCAAVVAPAVLAYAFWRRPGVLPQLPFVGGFLVAWVFCGIGQAYRLRYPCGAKRVHGAWQFESSYRTHMLFHETWHWILCVVLSANALWRPSVEVLFDSGVQAG